MRIKTTRIRIRRKIKRRGRSSSLLLKARNNKSNYTIFNSDFIRKQKQQNLKQILTKIVPYLNPPYAEHVLKTMGIDPNAKATVEMIPVLVEAAEKCKQLVQDLETSQIKGYIIYSVEEVKVNPAAEIMTGEGETKGEAD